jgi:hypothetical protein
MKKLWVVALVAVLGIAFLGTSAFAQCGMGYGYGGGPRGYGYGPGQQVDVNALTKFQKETLPLRDEMAAKRVEIANEYSKEKPDQTRIATLQKEMVDLRTKIQTVAEKQGLPTAGYGRGYGRGYGPGRMGGRGAGGCGYGGGYCSTW